jgi:hypothetical protein
VKFISNLARGESSNYSDIDVVYDVLFMRECARFSGFCYAVRVCCNAMQWTGFPMAHTFLRDWDRTPGRADPASV